MSLTDISRYKCWDCGNAPSNLKGQIGPRTLTQEDAKVEATSLPLTTLPRDTAYRKE